MATLLSVVLNKSNWEGLREIIFTAGFAEILEKVIDSNDKKSNRINANDLFVKILFTNQFLCQKPSHLFL